MVIFSENGGFLIGNINFSYIRIETNNLVWPVWLLAVSSCLISSLIDMVLLVLKVSKPQTFFFLKLHYAKNGRNIWLNLITDLYSKFFLNLRFRTIFVSLPSWSRRNSAKNKLYSTWSMHSSDIRGQWISRFG